jgi:AcrR family transcriptional regulator
MAAARELFAERGVSGVTTQQIADRADVAIGTLYRYAATKAELLIMVQTRPAPAGSGRPGPGSPGPAPG